MGDSLPAEVEQTSIAPSYRTCTARAYGDAAMLSMRQLK